MSSLKDAKIFVENSALFKVPAPGENAPATPDMPTDHQFTHSKLLPCTPIGIANSSPASKAKSPMPNSPLADPVPLDHVRLSLRSLISTVPPLDFPSHRSSEKYIHSHHIVPAGQIMCLDGRPDPVPFHGARGISLCSKRERSDKSAFMQCMLPKSACRGRRGAG